MNDKERFALAERVQKRIQEEQPHFWLTKRRDEINKEIEEEEKGGTVDFETSMKK